MNETPASGKFTQWNRPLRGGLISAGVATVWTGLGALVSAWVGDSDIDFLPLRILVLIIYLPALAFFMPGWIFPLVWFGIGAVVSAISKSNIVAIIMWVGILAASIFVAFGVAMSLGAWL